jgi:hypothetical protein
LGLSALAKKTIWLHERGMRLVEAYSPFACFPGITQKTYPAVYLPLFPSRRKRTFLHGAMKSLLGNNEKIL